MDGFEFHAELLAFMVPAGDHAPRPRRAKVYRPLVNRRALSSLKPRKRVVALTAEQRKILLDKYESKRRPRSRVKSSKPSGSVSSSRAMRRAA